MKHEWQSTNMYRLSPAPDLQQTELACVPWSTFPTSDMSAKPDTACMVNQVTTPGNTEA